MVEITVRIAVVHSRYRDGLQSGENTVVDEQISALTSMGHEVLPIIFDSNNYEWTLRQKLKVGLATSLHRGHQINPRVGLDVDLIHVHNTFPLIDTRHLAKLNIPTVATLHNFRSTCSNGLLLRDGQLCTKCTSGNTLPAVVHACYKNSRTQTIPLAIRTLGSITRDPLLKASKQIVCLSRSSRDLFESLGLSKHKLSVLPNFTEDLNPRILPEWSKPRFIFAGRLSQEKGLSQLLSEWPPNMPLDIFGEGPLGASLRSKRHPAVNFHGLVNGAEIKKRLHEYSGAVIPSTCLEMQPTFAAEALSSGVPLLARSGNAAAVMVEEECCGVVYGPGSLHNALNRFLRFRDVASQNARRMFEHEFSQQVWEKRISALYEQIVGTSVNDIP